MATFHATSIALASSLPCRSASDLYADMPRECRSIHEWTPAPIPKPGLSEAHIFWQFVACCFAVLVTFAALIMWQTPGA